MAISVVRYLKKKTILVSVKEYINTKTATCKSLCNLQEFYIAFKEKHPMQTLGSQSSVPRNPNGVLWLAQK